MSSSTGTRVRVEPATQLLRKNCAQPRLVGTPCTYLRPYEQATHWPSAARHQLSSPCQPTSHHLGHPSHQRHHPSHQRHHPSAVAAPTWTSTNAPAQRIDDVQSSGRGVSERRPKEPAPRSSKPPQPNGSRRTLQQTYRHRCALRRCE